MADTKKFRRPVCRKFRIAVCETAPSPSAPIGLPSRLKGVQVKTQVTVYGRRESRRGLKLALSDGTAEHVDVVVLATGYKIDVSKYDILDDSLRKSIKTTPDGYPETHNQS